MLPSTTSDRSPKWLTPTNNYLISPTNYPQRTTTTPKNLTAIQNNPLPLKKSHSHLQPLTITQKICLTNYNDPLPSRKTLKLSTTTHYHHQNIQQTIQKDSLSPIKIPSHNHPHQHTTIQKNTKMTHNNKYPAGKMSLAPTIS